MAALLAFLQARVEDETASTALDAEALETLNKTLVPAALAACPELGHALAAQRVGGERLETTKKLLAPAPPELAAMDPSSAFAAPSVSLKGFGAMTPIASAAHPAFHQAPSAPPPSAPPPSAPPAPQMQQMQQMQMQQQWRPPQQMMRPQQYMLGQGNSMAFQGGRPSASSSAQRPQLPGTGAGSFQVSA